jgi:multidrug efflux pump subunit AcrA (membrane-fusion protein)
MKRNRNRWLLTVLVAASAMACHSHEHQEGEHGHAHGPTSEAEEPQEAKEAHDDHHHGAGNLKVTLFSKTHELFVEIEPLMAGEPSQYTAHVSRLSDGRPATTGRLDVAFERSDSGGADQPLPEAATAEAPDRTGIFELAATSPGGPGMHRLTFRYRDDPVDTGWSLEVEVHPERVPVPDSELPLGVVGFSKEQQWRVPFRTDVPRSTEVRAQRRTRAVIAEDPTAMVFVSGPLSGRVDWIQGSAAPIAGRRVGKGELLGSLTVTPPPDHPWHLEAEIAQAEVQMTFIEADLQRLDALESSGLLTAGDESREHAALRTADAELKRAEQELKRQTSLTERGLSSQRDIVEAQLLVSRARAERARARRELERLEQWSSGRYELAAERVRSQAELARVKALHEALTARLTEVMAGGTRVLELRAPESGVLVSLLVPTGASVDAGNAVAAIRTGTSVLVEVQVLRADRGILQDVRAIQLCRSGWKSCRELKDPARLQVLDAPVFDAVRGMHSLSYRLNEGASLVPGEVLDATVSWGEARQAMTLPESAVIEDGTLPYVFVLADGEAFERRRVELGERLADGIVIRAGIAADDRVVIIGGYDIHVSSLTNAAQSHQH